MPQTEITVKAIRLSRAFMVYPYAFAADDTDTVAKYPDTAWGVKTLPHKNLRSWAFLQKHQV